MAILEEQINELIRNTINSILGIPDYAIKAKQSGAPRPAQDAFGSVDFVSDSMVGYEERELVDRSEDADLDATTKGMRTVVMSLSFFKKNATDNSRRVHIGLVREGVQDLFKQAKIGLLQRGPIRELSDPLEDGWEDRTQFDVFLSLVGTDEEIICSIQSLEISGIFERGTTTHTVTIEVQ